MAATARQAATALIKALGGNPANSDLVKAVEIWIHWESGSTIRGNNFGNQHYGNACLHPTATFEGMRYCPISGKPGLLGNRYAGPGDKNVAIYKTIDDGVQASANNLLHNQGWTGYQFVVAAVRAGDAAGFLRAIANSKWSAGNYRDAAGNNKLLKAFNGILEKVKEWGGGGGGSSSGGSTPVVPSGGTQGGPVAGFDVAGVLGKKDGDILTADDVDKIIRWVNTSAGIDWFKAIFPVAGFADTIKLNAIMHQHLDPLVGQPISAAAIAAALAVAGGEGGGVGKLIGQAGDALGFLINPVHWAQMAVLALGLVCMFVGFGIVMASASANA